MDGSLDFVQESLEQLLFEQFSEPEFLKLKLRWAKKELQQATDDWQGDKWAHYYLQLLEQTHSSAETIRQFCLANIDRNSVRKDYVKRCISSQDYDEAIKLLQEGKRRNLNLPGIARDYSEQLKALYQQLGQSDEYRHELWHLLTDGTEVNLDDYHSLAQQYSQAEWLAKREQLFDAIPKYVDITPLYVEDHLYDRLLKTVVSADGLWLVRRYERLLKPQYSNQLLEKYAQTVQQMAQKTGTRKHYAQLVDILRHMQQYPKGSELATKIAQDWQQKYVRRSAMMDELRRFSMDGLF